MNITKNSFSDLRFSTYTNKFLIKWTLKNTFFNVFSFSVPVRYCRFRLFFSKKQQYVTFVVVTFAHHATYRWKALEEQISNIYTFYFYWWKTIHFSYRQSYYIYLLPKKYVNSISHEYYQKLFLGFWFSYIDQYIPY